MFNLYYLYTTTVIPDWTDGILGELGEKLARINTIIEVIEFVLFNDFTFAE